MKRGRLLISVGAVALTVGVGVVLWKLGWLYYVVVYGGLIFVLAGVAITGPLGLFMPVIRPILHEIDPLFEVRRPVICPPHLVLVLVR